jgi:hypothetical protein
MGGGIVDAGHVGPGKAARDVSTPPARDLTRSIRPSNWVGVPSFGMGDDELEAPARVNARLQS